MTIITGPGFYASKAGKCEVKDFNGRFAIGWTNNLPMIWSACGYVQGSELERDHNITGPYIEPPPKRHECWVNVYDDTVETIHSSKERADGFEAAGSTRRTRLGPARRMVELREGEEPAPPEATPDMISAAVNYVVLYRGLVSDKDFCGGIYRAMISARPKP